MTTTTGANDESGKIKRKDPARAPQGHRHVSAPRLAEATQPYSEVVNVDGKDVVEKEDEAASGRLKSVSQCKLGNEIANSV